MCVAFGDKKIRASDGDKKMCVILGDQKMCVVFDDKNADQISNGCGVNKSGARNLAPPLRDHAQRDSRSSLSSCSLCLDSVGS